jgi:hypothetical protein
MIPIVSRVVAITSFLRSRLMPDSREAEIYRYFKQKHRPTVVPADVVLVQCVEDLFYFGVFGRIISSLREQRSIRAEQFVLRSLRVGESRSLLGFITFRLFINRLAGGKWVRLYKSFCDGVGYRSTGLCFLVGDVIDFWRAFACWRNLTDRITLTSLVIEGIPVGDLINDSFLRFKPAPTLDIRDVYLLIVIWQAHRDIRRAKDYFNRVRPLLYLTSYTTYVQHGIAVRVALQIGVRVFSFSNYQQFAKQLSEKDWMHTSNPDDYAYEFSLMKNSDQKLAEAEKALCARMTGGIDSATAYMKKSAYIESNDPVPDVRGSVVIFLHDFFDSPHVYRGLVFPDFWEWICFTIEILSKTGARFFLKPHPNQIELNDVVLKDLKQRYPEVAMISPNITNKQLAEAGVACAVTVYGTVAHEMAFLGVPSIACAHHPHVSFNFCKTAKNKTEYAEALLQYADINFNKLEMHRQSLIFYYMHNLNLSAEEKSLKDTAFKLRNNGDGSPIAHQDFSILLEEISGLPAFKAYISTLVAGFQPGKCMRG